MRRQSQAASDQASGKRQHDTGDGCRELARGSLAEAALSIVPNLKLRLEHSAAAWTKRAEMLEHVARLRSARLGLAETGAASAPSA